MYDKLFIGKLVKKQGQVALKNKAQLDLFNFLKKQMREGQSVSIVVNFGDDDGTLEQIAKVHAMIRALARHTGESYPKMKIDLKREMDFVEIDGTLKSFGDASKEELSDFIQTLIEWGEVAGIDLK